VVSADWRFDVGELVGWKPRKTVKRHRRLQGRHIACGSEREGSAQAEAGHRDSPVPAGMRAEVSHRLADVSYGLLEVEGTDDPCHLGVILGDLAVKEIWGERKEASLRELLAVQLNDLVQAVPLVDHDERARLAQARRLAKHALDLPTGFRRKAHLRRHVL